MIELNAFLLTSPESLSQSLCSESQLQDKLLSIENFLDKSELEMQTYGYASANVSGSEVCDDVEIMIQSWNNEKPVEATFLQSTSTTASVSARPTVRSSK